MSGSDQAARNQPIVIIGAGQAGGRAAEALRQGGHTGPLTVIGDEPHPPYERPSLSKEMLIEGGDDKIAWIRPHAWYQEAGVTLVAGRSAGAVERVGKTVILTDGTALPYGTLILATGAQPRPLRLEGADHPCCHTLRTLEDSRRLFDRLRSGAPVVVIGAGFIGLEVAAAARRNGCSVTVIEQADQPMARGVPPAVGAFFAALHRDRGTTLLTGATLTRISDRKGLALVETADGRQFPAEAVVIGIGVTPNTALAAAAGLEVDDGIVTDAYGRTSDAAIYAAGDVARHFNPVIGRHIRLESWQNAQNQAIAVAGNILGAARPYAEVPWFWSDQFEVNLQIAGLPQADDDVLLRGTPGDGPALYLHLRHGRLAAAIGLDAGRELRFAKEIIALGGGVDRSALADPAIRLADLYRDCKRLATELAVAKEA
ncbi:MAG TPA: FAD-dependent oxidoreductase [Magnetospirillaceae bacterium]|nr:FAD-dependent oxidoreductase [Magnetospirillaceae bacterium]